MSSSPEPRPTHVYKILSSVPINPFPLVYPLSELDAKDGFVHLSTAVQVPNTADLFFAEAPALWVVKFKLEKLADPVKWEGGFPHLYGNFGARDVVSFAKFERREEQRWVDWMLAADWLEW
ncbi:hypothetical protein ACQKWADRAFT_288715 [Trichoderma austrokoningii]